MKFKLPFGKQKSDALVPSTQKEREEQKAAGAIRAEARYDPNSRKNIAMPYIWIALSIFLGLCLYTDGCGFFGDVARFLFFGLFSYAAYAFPIVFFLFGISWRRSVANRTLQRRALLFFVALLLILALVYILTLPKEAISGDLPKEEVTLEAGSYFDYDAPVTLRGGFLGALTGWVLYRLVGPVMTIVLTALAVLLYGIYGFGWKPDAIVGGWVRFFRERRRASAERREQARAAHAEAVAAARAERARARAEAKAEAETAEAEAAVPTPALGDREPQPPEDPPARPADSMGDKHRRFADLFREAGSSQPTSGAAAATEPVPTPAAVDPHEELRAYKEQMIRERLRRNDGIHSYAVSDLRPTSAAPAEEAPRITVPPSGAEGGITHMNADVLLRAQHPEAPREEEPFRGIEDFRRITVSEPVRVHTAPVRVTPESRQEPEPPHTPSATSLTEAPPLAIADGAVRENAVIREEGTVVERVGNAVERPSAKREEPRAVAYEYPPVSLLHVPSLDQEANLQEEIQKNADTLVKTLENFGIPITITGYSRGPRITRYEFVQKDGIRVAKVASYADDITQKLSTQGVRIEAPIPNKSSIGVEVPNRNPTLVRIRSLLDTDAFRDASSKTTVAVGCDVTGNPIFFDIAKAPHMLIAGATGMGKSVCINSVLISLLYKASPEDVRMILIDPKKVEFNVYSKIPHLLVPVVTDPTKAAGALNWAVNEMEKRYDMIEEAGVRDIKSYNAYCKENGLPTLPKIVIVIDELNDLMMSARKMVEASICRIAQKARAAGIHLLIGTQRPSVNVITGDIKVNIPARIAFRVNQLVDSRTILDMTGAEKLLPQGDMLFSPAGTPQRVQGAFVDDDEVKAVVSFLAKNVGEAIFDDAILADIEKEAAKCAQKNGDGDEDDEGGGNLDGVMDDPKFEAALDVAFATGSISTSLLQRKISVGFGRASRFIDAMCEMGVVGESKGGAKPRELLMSRAEYEERRHRLFDE